MDDTSLALECFCLERKDRDHRRGGGVACYIRNDIDYNRLRELEDDMLEVLWIKVMLFGNNSLRTCKVIHTNYTICYLKRGVYIMI